MEEDGGIEGCIIRRAFRAWAGVDVSGPAMVVFITRNIFHPIPAILMTHITVGWPNWMMRARFRCWRKENDGFANISRKFPNESVS